MKKHKYFNYANNWSDSRALLTSNEAHLKLAEMMEYKDIAAAWKG